MRVKHSSHPLPRYWSKLPGADKAIFVGTIFALKRSRLGLKLLVFRNRHHLRVFWMQTLKSDLGPHCLGAVNALGCERVRFLPNDREINTLEVDPRYYAVMGLVQSHLDIETVSHECVHAAFAYYKRTGPRNLWFNLGGCDEEGVCYPAGLLTQAVWRTLEEEGLVE